MSGDRNLTASFSLNSYDLSILAGTGGSVTGSGSFSYGTDAVISASPSNGFFFAGWYGAGISNPNASSTTVDMSEDRNLSASFSLNSYDLSVLAGTGGSVTGSGTFTHGSSPTISANPSTGYSFGGWLGEGVSDPNASSTTVDMAQNQSISAFFTPKEYELEVYSISGGSVEGSGNYSYDSNASIIAVPAAGYTFSHWIGSGISNPLAPITNIQVSQNRFILAVFKFSDVSNSLNAIPIKSNWFNTWMGNIYQSENGWVFHYSLGWLYPQADEYGIWVWRENLGWLWTQNEVFKQNFLWRASTENWIFIDLEGPTEKRFFDYKSKNWFDL